MTEAVARAPRTGSQNISISNTDIVLVVLADLGGAERMVDIEDIAEAAWKAVPARFSWPRHQEYPDLDAVDVTLRAAKKNEQLVTGSKRSGWMLTADGVARAEQRRAQVSTFVERHGQTGRTENRRERGGLDSAAVRRLEQLRSSAAFMKHQSGHEAAITVYDFMAFFNINQYMPDRKYAANRQATENLVRDDDDLRATVSYLHNRFGTTYKTELQQREARA